MIGTDELGKLKTASRRAAVMSFVGLLFLIGSLVYSASQLRTLESRRNQLNEDISKLKAQKELTQSAASRAVELLNEKNKELTGPLVDLVHPQVHATPAPGLTASNGLPLYDFILSVSVPEARKSEITEVQYNFNHPTFVNQNQTSKDASNGFAVSYRGWGCLSLVTIRVVLKKGDTVPLYFDECKALGWS